MKSAILLAGLGARGETTVVEPAPTRDHTELMLAAAGAGSRGARARHRRAGRARSAPACSVPGDISSAAPFLVAAALLPGSQLTVHDVGLNPRRTGLLDVLERMGARVAVYNRRRVGGELVGDVEVGRAQLVATTVRGRRGAAARRRAAARRAARRVRARQDRVAGAEELRVKETDRIEAVDDALRAIGAHVAATARRVRRPRRADPSARRHASTRAATTGSRCSARSPALASREGVEIEGAEMRRR